MGWSAPPPSSHHWVPGRGVHGVLISSSGTDRRGTYGPCTPGALGRVPPEWPRVVFPATGGDSGVGPGTDIWAGGEPDAEGYGGALPERGRWGGHGQRAPGHRRGGGGGARRHTSSSRLTVAAVGHWMTQRAPPSYCRKDMCWFTWHLMGAMHI